MEASCHILVGALIQLYENGILHVLMCDLHVLIFVKMFESFMNKQNCKISAFNLAKPSCLVSIQS